MLKFIPAPNFSINVSLSYLRLMVFFLSCIAIKKT